MLAQPDFDRTEKAFYNALVQNDTSYFTQLIQQTSRAEVLDRIHHVLYYATWGGAENISVPFWIAWFNDQVALQMVYNHWLVRQKRRPNWVYNYFAHEINPPLEVRTPTLYMSYYHEVGHALDPCPRLHTQELLTHLDFKVDTPGVLHRLTSELYAWFWAFCHFPLQYFSPEEVWEYAKDCLRSYQLVRTPLRVAVVRHLWKWKYGKMPDIIERLLSEMISEEEQRRK